MVKRLAMRVEKPGARQLCAMKPSFSSARHTASSPRFQSQLGMFSRYACKHNTVNCRLSPHKAFILAFWPHWHWHCSEPNRRENAMQENVFCEWECQQIFKFVYLAVFVNWARGIGQTLRTLSAMFLGSFERTGFQSIPELSALLAHSTATFIDNFPQRQQTHKQSICIFKMPVLFVSCCQVVQVSTDSSKALQVKWSLFALQGCRKWETRNS